MLEIKADKDGDIIIKFKGNVSNLMTELVLGTQSALCDFASDNKMTYQTFYKSFMHAMYEFAGKSYDAMHAKKEDDNAKV